MSTLTIIDNEKVELIKRTFCKGATNEELELFVHACKRTGLDPFMRQIHAVKRWDNNARRQVMTIQTGIDGYRLIADRTGKYAPGEEEEYIYDNSGKLISAKAWVKKQTPDGTWHSISATAHYSEYVQTYTDKATGEVKVTTFWQKMGRIMLGKCAEALALRKAFPAELSGIYTKEEMCQAGEGEILEAESAEAPKIEAPKADPIKMEGFEFTDVYDSPGVKEYIDTFGEDKKHFIKYVSVNSAKKKMSVASFVEKCKEMDKELRESFYSWKETHIKVA